MTIAPALHHPSRRGPSQRIALSNLLFLLIICLSAMSCSAKEVQAENTPDNRELLLQAAREYGKGHRPLDAIADSSAASSKKGALYSVVTEQQYQSEIRGSLAHREFDKLEAEAHAARQGERVSGGAWRLILFYIAVGGLDEQDKGQEAAWKNRFDIRREWQRAKPESATPRIALANTYINYAAIARGDGFADTVSNDGWRLHAERAAMAASALIDAGHLKAKCPYWFESAQNVALDQGWSKPQSRELFELAAAFEPTYYHYYREYANYLLPKWYGDEGETEAFAEEVFRRVGGDQGKFLYFEIASQLVCQCLAERPPLPDNLGRGSKKAMP